MKKIKDLVKNYIYKEIIQNQNRTSFEKRNFIMIGDIVLGIIWFPVFIILKIVFYPFKIKIFQD